MNVYDFDGTIYDGDSTVDFFLYALKQKPFLICYTPRQAWGFLLYGLKRISKTKLKEYFFSFLSGIDAEKLAEDFWKQNHRKIYKWYLDQQRPDDIIISASPEFLLKPICRQLGIHQLIASAVDAQSGKFSGKNCYGPEKVQRLAAKYHVTHIDEFYSDSHSDLPLAQIADQAFLVKKGVVSEWK
jgi:HAD superfamily phosphoserine phosphatase-like hydrolase